jgi:hypothetical protein
MSKAAKKIVMMLFAALSLNGFESRKSIIMNDSNDSLMQAEITKREQKTAGKRGLDISILIILYLAH